MHIAEGSVKHQLPIVAVITIRAAAAGVYLQPVLIRGEIPWSGVMHLWCWKGGRFANNHTRHEVPASWHVVSQITFLH